MMLLFGGARDSRLPRVVDATTTTAARTAMSNHATARCRAAVFLVLVGLSSLTACGSESTSKPTYAGPPAELDVVSGDAQHGTVGKELSSPVVVRVVDAQQRPVSGQTVNFHVTAGGGSVFAGSSTTNADGVAQERWTLGTAAGADQTLEARAVDNATGQAIVFATFHATAIADVASRIAIVTAPGTSLKSGTAISPQPAVRLTDTYGNAVPQSGVTVTATITPPTNGHALTGQSAVSTNADGIATFTDLAVTGAAGPLSLTFSANGLTSAQSVALTLAAGAPTTIAATGATALTVNAGEQLSQLPTVVVKDAAGNGVPGVTVLFAVSQNGGSISPSSVTTDSNGEAALTQWTLPTATGSYMLVASAPALSSGNVSFNLTVLPGSASRLTAKSGDGTSAEVGTAGTLLVAHAGDEFGNAVSGANIGWAITAGGGSLSTASSTTDANGDARATLTLPQTSGQVHVTASRAGGPGVSFTVTAMPGAPTALAFANAPSSTAASAVALASQPIVELHDQFGNAAPRSGVSIHAEVPQPYSLAGNATVNTDANGRASFSGLAVAGPVGTATLRFASSGLTGVTADIAIGSGPSASLTAVSVTSIVDTAGAQVRSASLPAVIARDASGNPTAGVAVTFAVDGEGGTISADGSVYKSSVSLTTTANGIATVAGWRLPTSAGGARVTAVASAGTVLFTATVNPAVATSLVVSRQPSSTVQTAVALSQAPQLRLRDPIRQHRRASWGDYRGEHWLVVLDQRGCDGDHRWDWSRLVRWHHDHGADRTRATHLPGLWPAASGFQFVHRTRCAAATHAIRASRERSGTEWPSRDAAPRPTRGARGRLCRSADDGRRCAVGRAGWGWNRFTDADDVRRIRPRANHGDRAAHTGGHL